VCEERRIEMNFLKTRVNAQFQECGIHGQVRVFECDNSDGSNDGSGLWEMEALPSELALEEEALLCRLSTRCFR